MSSDSLICKVVEYDEVNKEVNVTYIFYDHNLTAFGIRGGYMSRGRKSYSFYCNNISGVTNFIKTLSDKFHKLTICLVKYDELYNVSDDIVFSDLISNDIRTNEIVGFDFWKSKGDAFSDKKSSSHSFNMETDHINVFFHRCLKSMVDVYNDY
jgi:hypothetical protein